MWKECSGWKFKILWLHFDGSPGRGQQRCQRCLRPRPNQKTPGIVDWLAALVHTGRAAVRKPLWTSNQARVTYITTYTRTMQMSSPILSLEVTWSKAMRVETLKSYRQDKKADKQRSKLSDNTSSLLTSRQIPEEMPVLVTDSLYCIDICVCHGLGLHPVWECVVNTQADRNCGIAGLTSVCSQETNRDGLCRCTTQNIYSIFMYSGIVQCPSGGHYGTLFWKTLEVNGEIRFELCHESQIWCEISSSYMLNLSVNNIIPLNTQHQHEHGHRHCKEKVLAKMKITIKLVILTTTVKSKGSLSVLWAANKQQQLKVTMYRLLPCWKKHHRPAPKHTKEMFYQFWCWSILVFAAGYIFSQPYIWLVLRQTATFLDEKLSFTSTNIICVIHVTIQTGSMNNLSLKSQ